MNRQYARFHAASLALVALAWHAVALSAPAAADARAAATGAQAPPLALGMAAASMALLPPAAGVGLAASADPWTPLRQGRWQLRLGTELAWAMAEEHNLAWAVRQHQIGARAVATASADDGRGGLMVRAAAGPTVVIEQRQRHQSERLQQGGVGESGVAWLAGAELQLGVSLRVVGPLGVRLRGGPAWSLGEAGLVSGFAGALEVAWLP